MEKINEDEHEQYLAHLRLKHILDTKAIEEYGYDRGKEEGIQEGIKQEKEKNKKEIVLNMYKEKIDINTICKIMKLNKKQVEEILNNA